MRSRVGPGIVASRLASWNGEVWNGLSVSSADCAGPVPFGRTNGSFSTSGRPAALTPSAAGVPLAPEPRAWFANPTPLRRDGAARLQGL